MILCDFIDMKYLGGKHKVGKKIAAFISRRCPADSVDGYYEPFCGSLGVFKHMPDRGYRTCTASDAHSDLIMMWKELKEGRLELPSHISESQYHALKRSRSPNSLKAVAGFGLSYGGKYFAGYSHNAVGDSGRDFYKEFKTSLKQIKPRIQRNNVKFKRRNYWEDTPRNQLVYCDPPYVRTEGYSTGDFDHAKFWDTMRKWSKHNCVFVSEETAPPDFKSVLSFPKRRTLDSNKRFTRMEKLFVYRPRTRAGSRRNKTTHKRRFTRRN